MGPDRHHHIETALLPDGWGRNVRLSVRDGRIAQVTKNVDAAASDERHRLVVPGLPNLHSHAFQRGMAGMTERRGEGSDSFWTWREVMYRFVDRLDPGDVEAIASLAFMEMLESGFTRVGEFNYLHHDRDGRPFANPAEMSGALANAADTTGIAITLLPVFYAHAGFGGLPPGDAQKRFACDLDLFGRILDASRAALPGSSDAVLGIAPHSLRAATLAEIATLLDLRPQGPVHIHVAEQVREVEDCLAALGARPVQLLLDSAAIDDRWCLIHATHMDGSETVRLAASGAVAGLCPITEANLGDGIFNACDFTRAGGLFGVGTDSNVLVDAAEELRTLEYGQRLLHRARNLLASPAQPHTGAAMFRASLVGGARALGATAGLDQGAPADFVELDLSHPSLAGTTEDACLDAWIFAAGQRAVHGVWRRGEQVVSGGRHRSRPAIVARYVRTMARVLG